MFFAKTDNLASSSTYKVLLYFIACVAMIFMLFIHQVFVSSEAFYHKQLDRELTSEASTFSLLVSVGDINKIYRLIEERSRASKTFFYRIQKRHFTIRYRDSCDSDVSGGNTFFLIHIKKVGSR